MRLSRDTNRPFRQSGNMTSCRTLFLSDLHLGAIGARADLALALLQSTRADTYVLVGDILDLWQPGPSQWGTHERAVIGYLQSRFRDGAKIIYVTGNHDPDAQAIAETGFLPVPAVKQAQFQTLDGSTYLIVHGDDADSRIARSPLLTQAANWMNRYLRILDARICATFGRADTGARSPIQALMVAANWILHGHRLHEAKLVTAARLGGYDGVICGHYHKADLHHRHGLTYANCGDWVDSFSALAETHDGTLTLLGGGELRSYAFEETYEIEGLTT